MVELLEIKAKIIESGWTMTKIVEELNKRHNTNHSVQNFSKKLRNETLRYKEVLEIAEILNYKVEWIKKDSTR